MISYYNQPISRILLFLTLLVLAVFQNMLDNGFTYDDNFLIVENQHNIGKIENIPSLFTQKYFYISKENSYRPVVTLSYFWDQFVGGRSPFFYHLSNLLLHLLNVFALYCLFFLLSKNLFTASFSAFIYSVHPALTEAVNGVGFREDLLSALFIVAAMIFHIKERALFSSAALVLALFSKEISLIVPLLFFVYDRLYQRDIKLRAYISYMTITVIYVVIRFYLLFSPAEKISEMPLSLSEKMIALPMSIFYYIKLLLFPFSLTIDYIPYAFMTIPPAFPLAFSVGISLLILLCLIKERNSNPVAKFGLYWFLITLIPVLNFVAIANPFAERYLYVPSAGIILAVVSLFSERNKQSVTVMLLIPVFFFAILSHLRNMTWKSGDTLWVDAVKKAPQSYRSCQNVASIYIREGNLENARVFLDKAIALKPDSFTAHNNMGALHLFLKDYNKAIEEFEIALKFAPSPSGIYLHLGIVYEKIDNYELSKQSYIKAIMLDKENPEPYLRLGIVFGYMGKIEEAIYNFQNALKIYPAMPEVHYNIGTAYEQKGMYLTANKEYIAELALNPSNNNARNGLARIFIKNELFKEATTELKAILKSDPSNEEAGDYLEYIYKIKKDAEG